MFNESKHKQEAVPLEEHPQLPHSPQLLLPRPLAIHQPRPSVMKANNQSIYLKQLRRLAEVAEELQAHVEDAREEQVALTFQASVPVSVQQLEQKAVLAVLEISISCATTLSSSSSVKLCRPSRIC